ncbi:MAG: carotenoid oxygenase family protein [Ilumatobacteraceae bacterium]|jgi:carotenoid cleavage dioxygenase|nr:carotenoid oxygenase family protein [Ilumatobacteraceae bacterium]
MTDLAPTPWFLKGNYAPVDDELTAFDLPVTGAIPSSLGGLYLRNGSNPKSGAAGHWFFGDGMVHGVRLAGGKAEWYRNRYVRTTKFEKGLDAMDPETIFDPTASAANTHVLAHAGRIWALEEGHLPYELTPELDTKGVDDFGGKLTTAFTAHPKLCPETGELHFFGYSAVAPFLTYHVLDASGVLVHSAEITVPKGTMMHDFMITRDHAIFMDLPVVFDLDNPVAPIRWDDDYGARIGILPRMGTDADVRWFEVEPCYVFHPLNAYVSGDTVVCDVGRSESMWRDSMDDFKPSYLHRWTFDLATGAVGEAQLDEVSHGFPRVDDRVVGLQHRYGWGAAPRAGSPTLLGNAGVVVKWDLQTGQQSTYDFGPTAHPGEFVFVQDSDAAGEDEGWAMGFVYEESTDTTDLVILDASAPGSEPVARVHIPQRVPFGFHGSWVDDSVLPG